MAPGTQHDHLREALERGDYWEAVGWIDSYDDLDVLDALRLTVLSAKADPERFDVNGMFWIGKATMASVITPADLNWLVPELSAIGLGELDGSGLEAEIRERVGR